jgi:hypothetical protein
MNLVQAHSFKPFLEVLEDRRLLAVSITVDGSTLFIKGSNSANTVVIMDTGSATAGNFVGSTIDGITTGDLAGTVITHVVVKLKDGSDTVTYSLSGDVVAPRDCTVNFGSGKDTFTFTEGEDISASGALAFYLNNNGGGADTIDISYSGELDGNLVASIVGGSGKETVDSDYTFSSGSAGFFNANYNMGEGNDSVTLSAVNLASSSATILALVDGDDGDDTCTVTPNVSVLNCED